MGTGKGDFTDDIYLKLCSTSLEHQHKWLELLRRYRQRRMRLWGRRPGSTRWLVLTISTRSPSCWESRTHSDMLSVQYLVNCMEEDNISHGITIQEPRPIKETLHSRHHSTVLPRLGSNRMESHQNLHTHAVDSAIQLPRKQQSTEEPVHPQYWTRSRDSTEDNDTLSHNNGQNTAIYCRTTSIGCLVNQATSVQTVELHHKMWDTCSLAPHTWLTCHQRIYGGIQWDQLVRLAISTTETLTDLKTDLVVANNNNSKLDCYLKDIVDLPGRSGLFQQQPGLQWWTLREDLAPIRGCRTTTSK